MFYFVCAAHPTPPFEWHKFLREVPGEKSLWGAALPTTERGLVEQPKKQRRKHIQIQFSFIFQFLISTPLKHLKHKFCSKTNKLVFQRLVC